MIVATWNVLHRVHAVNWGEAAGLALDEPARIEAIARRVDELLAFSAVVCLQEVSGDQLRVLRAPHVFRLAYPRVPRPRRGEVELDDPTEYLVVLSSLQPGEVLRARVFPSDPGKGFLSVALHNGLVVCSAHISFGDRGRAQLAELAAHAREQAGRPVVIGGDLNADRATVMAALGEGFSAAPLSSAGPSGRRRRATPGKARLRCPPGRHTRPRTAHEGKSQDIDHVIGLATAARDGGVGDGTGLSDHNPVWASFG